MTNSQSTSSLTKFLSSPWSSLKTWYNQHDIYDKATILAAVSIFSIAGFKILQQWNTPRVTDLIVYPIKGCKGISFKELDAMERGFEFDRKWMIVIKNDKATDKGEVISPFITQRQYPVMATLHVQLINLERGAPDSDSKGRLLPGEKGLLLWYVNAKGERREYVQKSLNTSDKLLVEIWGSSFTAFDEGDEASAFLKEFFSQDEATRRSTENKEFRLVRSMEDESFGRRPAESALDPKFASDIDFADEYPYLLVSQQSVMDFARLSGQKVTYDRFRPNIVISGGIPPYDEEKWYEMTIGKFTFVNPKTCTRCTVPTIDQNTGIRDLSFNTHMRKHRGGIMDGSEVTLFGVNLSGVKGEKGKLRVGDLVKVVSRKPLDYEPKDLTQS